MGNAHYNDTYPVSFRWFPLFHTFLQGVCIQTSEASVSTRSFITVLCN